MNWSSLQKSLFALARRLPADERVPYAFEKRVMARLTAIPALDPLALWSRLLWRAVAPCMAICFLTVVIAAGLAPEPADPADEMESALLAPIQAEEESW